MVRDIRRVGIGEGVRIVSGVRNSISSGLVTIVIVDDDSSRVSGLHILSIGDKINGDSESISVSNSSLDNGVGVYDCIIIFITIVLPYYSNYYYYNYYFLVIGLLGLLSM